ncbi:MAG: DUF3095 family protein [Alphaproteobacteria bacterium]|nr:DUF3095 family protein [Alphaproteobacteria bacterium]
MSTTDNADFYETVPSMSAVADAFDPDYFVAVPDGWFVAVSDIEGSTAAVAEGRHSDINFCAAAMIAGLSNHCGSIPYQFGGDGAAALIPPHHADEARRILARVRRFAMRDFNLKLRVGLAPIQALRERDTDVLVGRYEPSPGNAYAVFLGGGVELLETSVKARGDDGLLDLCAIPEEDDDGDPPDLTGLSCRWTPLTSTRGEMVALVVRGPDHGELYAALKKVTGVDALKAASLKVLKGRWPPSGLMREAKARRGAASLFTWTIRVGLETLLAYLIFKFKIRIGPFDPEGYRKEMIQNAVDFARSDDMLCLTFDCPSDRLAALESYLDERYQRGELHYGIHKSDHAVMTCLVASAVDNQHVHFVDGGDGGYTKAATQMKAQIKAAG